VPLTLTAKTLKAQTDGMSFQCDRGDGNIVQCGIADIALRDLIDFHRIQSTSTDSLRVLLPEIERLADAKYEAGRLEEDGGLLIRSTDLVRYGFERPKRRAAA
jgi:hypothetical protein